MGIKVSWGSAGVRVFPHARDWYVTDERVLQIYQDHDGDAEFVVAEFSSDTWHIVEYDPPVAVPQSETEEGLVPGKWYREHTAAQLRVECRRRDLYIAPTISENVQALAQLLIDNDKKNERKGQVYDLS